MNIKMIIAGLLIITGTVFSGEVFKDTFDGTEGGGLNDGLEQRQSGSASPSKYSIYAFKADELAVLQDGAALLGVVGKGSMRMVPEVNLALALSGKTFEISYTAKAGLNYTDKIHGSYLTSVLLGQESLVKSSAGLGNPQVALGIGVAGNGRVSVFCAGQEIFHQVAAQKFMVSKENTIRLLVSAEGFLKDSTATFTLYINEEEVCKGTFKWSRSKDLYIGLQADNWSAAIDNLLISE
jgi:hypothetical protein